MVVGTGSLVKRGVRIDDPSGTRMNQCIVPDESR